MENIKGIILDYGGTIDTGGIHWSRVIRNAWEKAGVVADEALFREAYVFGEQELERSLEILPHHNFSDLLSVKIRLELQFLASNGHLPPQDIEPKAAEIASYCYAYAKEGVEKSVPVLQKLSQKYPIVLVSNFYGNLEAVIKDFNLSGYFKKVIDSAVVGTRKPDVEIFRLAIKELHCKPEETLVIGDSYENDIAPASSLGCQTLWLKGEGWSEADLNKEDRSSIESLDEIFSFIDGK